MRRVILSNVAGVDISREMTRTFDDQLVNLFLGGDQERELCKHLHIHKYRFALW